MNKTLADVKRLYQKRLEKYQPNREFRTVYLGDGRGTATSNMYVPGAPDYVWARHSLDTGASGNHFAVLNRVAVNPAFGLPVYIGYKDEEVETLQIVSINFGNIGASGSVGASVGGVGSHHRQHEFGGSDEVFIDGLQFKPGSIAPTSPPSMTLQVFPFHYYWNTWGYYAGGVTASLAPYLPDTGFAVYVLICLDPDTGSLVYRVGNAFSYVSQASLGNTAFNFEHVPAPSGYEYPLGYATLISTTTSLNWGSVNNNLTDARLHIVAPMRSILDRLTQLESLSGNQPSLAVTGVG